MSLEGSIQTGTPDWGEWDDLVTACPWGSFYHTSANLELISRFTGAELRFLTIRDVNGLSAGLAWCEFQGALGDVANALAFFGSYGEAISRPDLPPQALLPLYSHLVQDCRERGLAALTVITSPFASHPHAAWLAESLAPPIVDNRICQITPLPDCRQMTDSEAEEAVMKIIDGKARTSVRRAHKDGVVVRLASSAEEVLQVAALHQANIGGKGGRSKPTSFFTSVWEQPEAGGRVVVADWDGRVIGGVIFFEACGAVEYHTTGMDMEQRTLAPLNAIIFQQMVQAARRGVRSFNFGGTWKSQEGVYRFKASFGAKDQPYRYLTWVFEQGLLSLRAEQLGQAYPMAFVVPYDRLTC